MRNRIFNIGKSVLPLVAVLALAFVLAQFHFAAGAGPATASSGHSVCAQPCDPSNCPQPCAQECTGVKSAVCPTQAVKTSAACDAPCDPSNCPMPCAKECIGVKSAACPAQTTTAVAGACVSECKMAGSADCAKCPVPCTEPCQMGSSKCATKTVAQVK